MYVEYHEPKNRFNLSKREIMHILIAWLVITFAFSFQGSNLSLMLIKMPMILLGTLTGFIFHELAHKYAANHYGAFAEFYMWPLGLLLAAVMAILPLGIIFAAPGAVYIAGRNIGVRENGIISLAGPFANLIVAIILYLISVFTQGYISAIFFGGAFINIFLGFFNMIPIYPLDGSKVLAWNKIIWVSFFAIFLTLLIFAFR